ncbi:MAG: NAD-dependent deacetylase, partial [Congregibacter sp.]|nr:NAD-dependent deacetylase [Congregibacter sp.]
MNYSPALQTDTDFLDALMDALPALVLTGAGISVATGIPTYRDESGTWLRSAPITHREFLGDARQRQRYWGRSLLGWPAVRDARPAQAHRLLAQLEALGAISHIITQNVDRLHQRAGSAKVTDLHGRLDRVVCLGCQNLSNRDQLQAEL